MNTIREITADPPASASECAPTRKVRLSIPFWGDAYLHKMLNITLPALLAPGNLPALAADFDVEVALVTESRFFHLVRRSRAFLRLSRHAVDVRLISVDDLLTGISGDYGPVLTFALIRGYEDLGERMLDYFLMFLNADFILADGSYRTVARLIKEGHRVIHSPSFRGIAEEVIPELEKKVDKASSVLAIPPRELVALALRHKHITVKARIINQRLCHQRYMDQFYWYVDEHTMIGYQLPIALVGLRPERVVTRPPLMFDYGFIPEICPTAKKYYISDSDDFFMLEPEKRLSGQEELRLGWTTPDAIITYLAKYSTREQRECGEQMHVYHSADLPPQLPAIAEESRGYMSDLMSRLGPPKPHERHPLFHEWWAGAVQRMEASRAQCDARRPAAVDSGLPVVERADGAWPAVVPARSRVSSVMRNTYERLFGGSGQYRLPHPLWICTHLLSEAFRDEAASGASILWVSAPHTTAFGLARQAHDRLDLREFRRGAGGVPGDRRYDACFFDLTLAQSSDFNDLYRKVRGCVRNGGRIYLNLVNRDGPPVDDLLQFCEQVLPDVDVSEVIFMGGNWERRILRTFSRITGRRFTVPFLQRVTIGATLAAFAPIVYANNRRHVGQGSFVYTPYWLNLFARFTVIRQENGALETLAEPAMVNADLSPPVY